MLLRAKHIISAITERVNAGAVEIIEIIEKYEEELRLAKEEIDRQRQLLTAAVPQQTPLKDVQRCEFQLSVCEEEIPPLQLHRDEVKEESDSSDSQYTVYPVSIASIRFEELTECQQTGREDNLADNMPVCHEAEEPGGSEEAHCSFSQIDVDQMREYEEPKPSPGQALANMTMDNPEIQQEEEDKEMSSSSNIDDKGSKNTQDDTEDHTMSKTSNSSLKNVSIPLHGIQLMQNSGGDCMPSSPAQQMKETTQEALNATEGRPLFSPHLPVAPSQDGRDDQGGQQSHQNQYNCHVCEKGFKHCSSLERHTKRKHQNQCNGHGCEKGSKHRRSMACTWIDQMREVETKSSPGEDAANMMDNPEIQQEEEDVSSSSNIDKCKNTQDDTEDHTMSTNSSPRLKDLSIPLHRILLMENSGGDCMPSSPAQQMRDRSMNRHREDEEPKSSPENMMDNPEIQQKEGMSSSSNIDDKSSRNTQADAEDHVMSSTQHTEKPHQSQYSCHVCEKEFKHCQSMKRHMKNQHRHAQKSQNQYYCHVCGDGFEFHKNMKRHVKSHHRHMRGK